MKRLLILAIAVATAAAASAQFSVGLRDNRYVNVSYTLRGEWNFKLEHSVFSEKPGLQYVRAYVGYTKPIGIVTLSATPYFGAVYNGDYHSFGAIVDGKVAMGQRLTLIAAVNPHYDSLYEYETCFSAGAKVDITKQIDAFAAYTTIPEYRISEKRVRVGLTFKVGNLWVSPALSIPADEEIKQMRVLAAFGYTF